MSTDLEKYLREKRSRLDVESPDDTSLWAGISRGIGKGSGGNGGSGVAGETGKPRSNGLNEGSGKNGWAGKNGGTGRTGKPGGRTIMLRFRNIAAIVLVALLTGYMINDIIRENSPAAYMLPGIADNNLVQKEREYKRLIRYKKQEIGSFDNVDNMIIKELTEELSRLDTIYETVMNDLKEYGYNEKIINTIFDTYEKKIRTLELIIMETNKEKRYESEENTTL